jgi:membrane-associated phospholipid phosphatase
MIAIIEKFLITIIARIVILSSYRFSRIYLDIHWLSDALTGYFLEMLWLTFLILVLNGFIPLSNKTNGSIKSI